MSMDRSSLDSVRGNPQLARRTLRTLLRYHSSDQGLPAAGFRCLRAGVMFVRERRAKKSHKDAADGGNDDEPAIFPVCLVRSVFDPQYAEHPRRCECALLFLFLLLLHLHTSTQPQN